MKVMPYDIDDVHVLDVSVSDVLNIIGHVGMYMMCVMCMILT